MISSSTHRTRWFDRARQRMNAWPCTFATHWSMVVRSGSPVSMREATCSANAANSSRYDVLPVLAVYLRCFDEVFVGPLRACSRAIQSRKTGTRAPVT